MTAGTIADITPNSSATQFSSTSIVAHVLAVTASGTSLRIGDANVGSGRGAALQNGVCTVFQYADTVSAGFDLSQVYVYGTGSDKISISYWS